MKKRIVVLAFISVACLISAVFIFLNAQNTEKAYSQKKGTDQKIDEIVEHATSSLIWSSLIFVVLGVGIGAAISFIQEE